MYFCSVLWVDIEVSSITSSIRALHQATEVLDELKQYNEINLHL